MARKIEGWIITCDRYVAFLDIMGFRDRVFRESHEEVKKMLESLRPAIEFIKIREKKIKGNRNKLIYNDIDYPTGPTVFLVSFSDSFILISRDSSMNSAYGILLYAIV